MGNEWFEVFILLMGAYWVGVYVGGQIERRKMTSVCKLCDLDIDSMGRRL